MSSAERLRADLDQAIADTDSGLSVADRLCHACVSVLGVDGAAISLVHEGAIQGTFGSSSELSRRLDGLQFTFGEGPCLDAVLSRRPVLVPDLQHQRERRWPVYAGAVLEAGVRAVFALPVALATLPIGALDLYRHEPGSLGEDGLVGGLLAAEFAALPLLDLVSANTADERDGHADVGWDELAALERVEVYQATGMIMAQLDVGPDEALVRLRAHAFAQGMTASDVAWAIIERRLVLDVDTPWGPHE